MRRAMVGAIATLALGLGPLLLAAAPAGATVYTDDEIRTLHFVGFGHEALACDVINDSMLDTDDPSHPTLTVAWGGTPGASCSGDAEFTVMAAWLDRDGVARSFSIDTFTPGTVVLDGPVSRVSTTVNERFFTCDPDFSSACSITVAAAPK